MWNITVTTRDFGPVLQKIARIQLRKLCVPKKSCTSWEKHEQSKMGSFKNLRWTCVVYCISHVSLSSKPCILCLSTVSKCIYTWVYLHILYIQLGDQKNMILHQETLMYVYIYMLLGFSERYMYGRQVLHTYIDHRHTTANERKGATTGYTVIYKNHGQSPKKEHQTTMIAHKHTKVIDIVGQCLKRSWKQMCICFNVMI